MASRTPCTCPKLYETLSVLGLCPPCKLYRTDASFYRRRWEKAIGDMEEEYRAITGWINEEYNRAGGLKTLSNLPEYLDSPKELILNEKDLEELYKVENGPPVQWESHGEEERPLGHEDNDGDYIFGV
ncbi:hypothetical protein TWF718_005283 [Orbilia javanica]|uniref:Uncharacterized protein n=1 Tax=Orbilia javanica TaxID=47235 RepID=A0AAN8RNT1_9PEZI